ncbi:hypothetical protein [Metabacillus rhizolycopersici]|uniref:Uncharacterized protein n=1 Tax=Metabacillus rhizolycopersici TaxID=2875709 RepID=A0ABS7UQX8_9BACI|nr:hypothetical protein [Metabacillus rhizolycopersici]MBZ5750340.1 hypothetical protein [Metabacillus rhizolycopersici]
MKNINNDEAQLADGMNFDIDEIQPFLNRLSSSVLDSGFTDDEINSIQSEIEKMKENNEVKEIGIFNVNFNGQQAKIRIKAEIHIEDELKEVVLYMYSNQELVEIIDEEMMKHADEIGA